jgi:molybdenum cofactor cytidylyltransferase
MAEIPILLLAAGASRRMGRSKQLLPWGHQTLIEHQVQTLLKTGQPVVVVLGHQSERILPLLQKYPVLILIHEHWDRGMGSTIAFGIGKLAKTYPEASGALVTQLDQPLITERHYNELLSTFQPDSKQIIVSRSRAGWEGVPVLFDSYYFEALQRLDGEEGAKKVFRGHSQFVKRVESFDILEDMDTPGTYQEFLTIYRRRSGSNEP